LPVINLYEDTSSILSYLSGNCTWIIDGSIAGHPIQINAPFINITTGINTGVTIRCEVNGTILLQAVVKEHGKGMLVCVPILIFH